MKGFFLSLEYSLRNRDQNYRISLSRTPKINICREFGNNNLVLLIRENCGYEFNCKKRKYRHIELSRTFRCSRMRAVPCSLAKTRWYFTGLLPIAYLAYSSTLKVEAVRSYQTARCHIPQDGNVAAEPEVPSAETTRTRYEVISEALRGSTQSTRFVSGFTNRVHS
jgi:hypothetical protein